VGKKSGYVPVELRVTKKKRKQGWEWRDRAPATEKVASDGK